MIRKKKINKYIQRKRHDRFVSRLENQPEVVSPKEIIREVAAMFCYHAKDVREVLDYYSNNNVIRIGRLFVDIIDNKKYSFHKGQVKLTVGVDKDIKGPVKALVTLKMSDIVSEKMVRAMINELFGYNKNGKYKLK